jgi:hypothetical protein
MTNREKIRDKIKGLLSKTIDNGCTEPEMLSALDTAQALMDAYQITDDDLKEARDDAVQRMQEAGDQVFDPHGVKWHISNAVGDFCDVQIYRMRHQKGLNIIGTKSDCDWTQWLLDHLSEYVVMSLAEHLIRCTAPPNEKRTVMASFVQGAAATISDRLRALMQKSEQQRTSNGRELMIIKSGAVTAFMEEHEIKLSCSGGGGPRNFNSDAHAAGQAAGNAASFGRPVSGPAAVLRIGK